MRALRLMASTGSALAALALAVHFATAIGQPLRAGPPTGPFGGAA